MGYRIRDGVILKCICGEHLLFAIGEAAEHCLYVRQINDSFAFFWQLTADGLDEDAVVMCAKKEFDAPEELLRADYRKLLHELVSMGYLIPGKEAEA